MRGAPSTPPREAGPPALAPRPAHSLPRTAGYRGTPSSLNLVLTAVARYCWGPRTGRKKNTYVLYTYPRFFRQSGIGNRLFPWARAYLFAKDHAVPIVWPNWMHFRRGPLLRGGVNWRDLPGKIYLFGNFKPDQSYVHGFRKQVILRTGQFSSEQDLSQLKHCRSTASHILIFEGDRNHFADFAARQAELKAALMSIASPSVISELKVSLPPIALNIRRGKDFRDPSNPHEFQTTGGLRTPLEWFVLTLQRVRSLVGSEIGAYVISDGDEVDLRPVLSLRNTVHIKRTTALADLLLISQARFLIASGGSSFSAWGAFLSDAPTLCISGQSFTWFGLSANRVGAFDPVKSSEQDLLPYCAALTDAV